MSSFVFIAGPYKGVNKPHDYSAYEDIDRNISRARYWAAELARRGIYFFCPHLNSAHFEVITPEVPDTYWYHLDLDILKSASAILMIPGWEESQGAQRERTLAEKLGIPVFTVDQLDALAEAW